tara:strand:- start:6893 stop:7201 length:309 start_codon:yes stop_codon:yes gene_type:complete
MDYWVNPSTSRCAFQSEGSLEILTSFWEVSPEGSLPASMAFVISGARNASRIVRATKRSSILSTDMYLSDYTPAMKPIDAFACIAQRTTQRVPIAWRHHTNT